MKPSAFLDLLPRKPTITVLDIGAMIIPDGVDDYQPLVDAGIARIIGFEPNEVELAKLQARAAPTCPTPWETGRSAPCISASPRPPHRSTSRTTR
jgi:hypothetical protein